MNLKHERRDGGTGGTCPPVFTNTYVIDQISSIFQIVLTNENYSSIRFRYK